jgi:hypothetical protein
MLKDPYHFDFLGLGDEAKERDVELALIRHITRFLLELGAGFAFVGRQYRLEVAGDEFFIDLLFYHTRLKCYVVAELKASAFKLKLVFGHQKTARTKSRRTLRPPPALPLDLRYQVSPALFGPGDARSLPGDRLCVQWRCQLLECNGEPDHVHLLVETEPTTPLTKLINNLKTVSSRLLRRDYGAHLARHYRKPVLWSPSYCLISCGGAPLDIIKHYIQNQAGAD